MLECKDKEWESDLRDLMEGSVVEAELSSDMTVTAIRN